MTDLTQFPREMLEQELRRREAAAAEAAKQPKTVTLYAYGDDMDAFEKLRKAGLTDKQIESRGLARLTYEVGLTFEIDADLNAFLTKVDGIALEKPAKFN